LGLGKKLRQVTLVFDILFEKLFFCNVTDRQVPAPKDKRSVWHAVSVFVSCAVLF